MNSKNRVDLLISSEHPIFLDGMRVLLRDQRDIEIVGQALTLPETDEQIARLHPDVVLLDIPAHNSGALESIRRMRQLNTRLKILALSISGELDSLETYQKAGVSDFVYPAAGIHALTKMIHAPVKSDGGATSGAPHGRRRRPKVRARLLPSCA